MSPTVGVDIDFINKACKDRRIMCAKALVYEKGAGLHFNLGGYPAFMPREEVAFNPDGSPVKEAAVVTRVNKNVCFIITDIQFQKNQPVIMLSRRRVQEEFYNDFITTKRSGDIISCNVTHVDTFGVFCDIGYGVSALLPIDFISVSRISRPRDRFSCGQDIFACIKNIGEDGRIVLTHKELLGTWEENACMFRPLSNRVGIVRSIEDYGIFIELSPNLAGLAETCEGIQVGDVVNVYIKSILPDKMKIKLVIMSTMKNYETDTDIKYYLTQGHIDYWRYSTDGCKKIIETVF